MSVSVLVAAFLAAGSWAVAAFLAAGSWAVAAFLAAGSWAVAVVAGLFIDLIKKSINTK